MSEVNFSIETVESAPFAQNAFILSREGRDDAIVIDPGFDVRAIFAWLEHENRTVAAILNTHGHLDHIAGNQRMKDAFPNAPLIIGRNDAQALSDPELNLSENYGIPISSPPADRLLDDGEQLGVGGFVFEVREIPGHSPGSVVFIDRSVEPHFVLGGDVLFAGSVGRTDLPGGSHRQLMSGIQKKLLDLPDSTLVYPGHGPRTTIGRERAHNPFILDYARVRSLAAGRDRGDS